MLLMATSLCAQETVKVISPDGKIKGEITLEEGRLSWKMDYRTKPVILSSSSLGIGRFTDGLRLKKVTESKQDTIWHPVVGERRSIRDNYSQINIRLVIKTGNCKYCFDREVDLEVRAYNEGIAFRYNLLEILIQGAHQADRIVD